MKKQTLLLVIALMLFLIGLFSAQAARPNVIVSGFGITKGSAAVGKDFILSVTLTNTEPSTCAKTITSSLQVNFPFIMKGISTLAAGDLCKNSNTVVNFPLKIDPTAIGGSYPLTISNNYETVLSEQFSSSSTINIFVNGSPDIHAYIINSEPADVYAGDTATITVNIENDGTFQAQSLTAILKADKPLEAVWSKSFYSLSLLDAKQAKTADFSIDVPKNAEAKDYNIHLEVTYLDENLVSQTRDFTLVFYVKKKALFEISNVNHDALYQNQNSKIVQFVLKNTGTDSAYKIKAKLLPLFPFSTDGSVRYIDVLEPGKSTPIELSIDTDKNANLGTYGLDLLLDFEDAQGKTFQDTAKVSLTVQSKGFAIGVFQDYWFVWLALIVIIGLIVRKKILVKKKKE